MGILCLRCRNKGKNIAPKQMLMKRQLTTAALAALTLAGTNAVAAGTGGSTSVAEKIAPAAEDGGLKLRFGEKGGQLKITGYLQAQWQLAQQKGIDAFGDGGSFGENSDNRFMLRRGRVKFTYDLGVMQVVFQPDFSEKGVKVRDAYIKLTAPSQVIGGQVGIFDRPFGYEIGYSSSYRETPERSRVYLSLFPNERDLGAMLSLSGRKGTFMSRFMLNGGLFNGNGVGEETDSRKDFIGRLAYLHTYKTGRWGAAFSYYNGGVLNPVNEKYKFVKDRGFVKQEGVQGEYSKRQYFGFAAQVSQQWAAGTTHVRAEYLWGKQPGTQNKNADPGGTSFGAGSDPLYLRSFRGAYVYFIQDIGKSKHSLVFKYDNYDPNTKIGADRIGRLPGTGAADVAYNTYGVGYMFRWNKYLTLSAYYDMVSNEKCPGLANDNPLKDYARNIKDNVLTLRIQAKF